METLNALLMKSFSEKICFHHRRFVRSRGGRTDALSPFETPPGRSIKLQRVPRSANGKSFRFSTVQKLAGDYLKNHRSYAPARQNNDDRMQLSFKDNENHKCRQCNHPIQPSVDSRNSIRPNCKKDKTQHPYSDALPKPVKIPVILESVYPWHQEHHGLRI
jgi:hypothetical protein